MWQHSRVLAISRESAQAALNRGSLTAPLADHVVAKHPGWQVDRAKLYTLWNNGLERSIISVEAEEVRVGDQVEFGGWVSSRSSYALGRPQGDTATLASVEVREWIRPAKRADDSH